MSEISFDERLGVGLGPVVLAVDSDSANKARLGLGQGQGSGYNTARSDLTDEDFRGDSRGGQSTLPYPISFVRVTQVIIIPPS